MGPTGQQYGYYGEQKKGFNWKVIIIVVAGLILITVAIAVISAINGQNSIGTQSQHLSARLNNLSTLTGAATKQLKNSDLQKINAEVSLINDGVKADLVSILPTKPDKAIVSSESDATDTTDLANAALAGTYDSVYKTVLSQKLETINASLSEIYDKTSSKSLRVTLANDSKNLQAIASNLDKVSP